MRLDFVHDLQKVFRKILAAIAGPGSIVDLCAEADLFDLETGMNKGILLVALTLLDTETSFAVSASDPGPKGKAISQLCYSKVVDLELADFVFVLEGGDAAAAIAGARPGSLIDPHLGATLIIEVPSLGVGKELILSGPGIESSAGLDVGMGTQWLAARSAKNVECPLGVDLLLVDRNFHLAALPRTTRVGMGT